MLKVNQPMNNHFIRNIKNKRDKIYINLRSEAQNVHLPWSLKHYINKCKVFGFDAQASS